MKTADLVPLRHYKVKVDGRTFNVRLDSIQTVGGAKQFRVTNTETNRPQVVSHCRSFLNEVAEPLMKITTVEVKGADAQSIDMYAPRGGQYASTKTIDDLGPAQTGIACPKCQSDEWEQTHKDVLDPAADRFECSKCGHPFKRYDPAPSPVEKPRGTVVEDRKPSSLADRLTKPKPSMVGSHLLIEARAGTGKTTTLVEGLKILKGLPTSIKPSPQQQEIWTAMAQSAEAVRNGATIGFTAFNKSIAEELQRRVPAGVAACTMHSLGNSAVSRAFGRIQPTEWAVKDRLATLMGKTTKTLFQEQPALVAAVDDLVNLAKSNLTDTKPETLSKLASHYDIDLGDMPTTVFQMVAEIVELSKNPSTIGKMSFTDMIWLPVVLKLPVSQYDLLLVDEAQDLNRCQQSLARMAGRRLILCGDPKQAIYGFAGADSESMPRMFDELNATDMGCERLPLNVTRRCGKAIVAEAQKYVPDFYAHESNPAGEVKYVSYGDKHGNPTKDSYHGLCREGDMVLCRVNAPLVRQCFLFIKLGKRANIQGRDVGVGLVSTVKKLMKDHPTDAKDGVKILTQRLEDWFIAESAKERDKANPSEQKLLAISDRHDCLQMFCEDHDTTQQVIDHIGQIFTDKKEPGIRLSSIHKAKGLEAHRVFLLQPEGARMPHPMAKTKHAIEQEYNLLYVGTTRAIETLYQVS